MERSADAKPQLASFGEVLKKHRLAAGLTRERLAERARLSARTISALEQGSRQKPYRDTIAALANALGLSDESRVELERAAAQRLIPNARKIGAVLNLPHVVTPLVDRVEDVRAILELLAQYRLVTITGSGGVGKTRVAMAAGEQYARLETTDVAFVDLSPLANGSLIADAVAAVCGAPPVEDRALLLILDNCEHLVDEVAAFGSGTLRSSPGVVILATSRERLDVPGEAIFRLPSLTFPDNTATSANVDAYSAVKFFVERAKAVDSRFGVSDQNVNVIADICRRLEGIPLAIELAAARLPVLGLSTLRARLDERFMLVAPVRGVPSRHATMYATISWSYSLLAQNERMLLNRLGIFVDGFTLEAAEHVCADERLHVSEIANLLLSLVDKSLVNVALDVDPPRYRLLDSVRAFALEQLAVEDGRDIISRRHAYWLVGLARKFERSREEGTANIAQTLSELGNVRAALQWGLDSKDNEDAIAAGKIAGALRNLWLATHRLEEYRFWAESLIERIDEAKFAAVVSELWAGLVQATYSTPAFLQVADRALAVFERTGDFAKVMHLQSHVASFYDDHGQAALAESLLNEALRIGDEQHLECSIAYLNALGSLAQMLLPQRSEEARAHVARAFALLPNNRPRWHRWLMMTLSEIEFATGNVPKALEIAESAHQQFPEMGADTAGLYLDLGTYYLLMNRLDAAERFARDLVEQWREGREAPWSVAQLAAIVTLRGDPTAGARLLGFVDEWRDRNQLVPGPVVQASRDFLIQALQERLSESAINELRMEGRSLTLSQAIDHAFASLEVWSGPR